VLDVLDILAVEAGVAAKPIFEPLRFGELRRSALDTRKIGQVLNWAPTVALRDGLVDTYRALAAIR
jgi:nucleoside-diphosphate-sugar epimerase